jgi:hypothetical protein
MDNTSLVDHDQPVQVIIPKLQGRIATGLESFGFAAELQVL